MQLSERIRSIEAELGVKRLQLDVNESYNSKKPEHRRTLREALAARLENELSDSGRSSLANLDVPPEVDGVDISISHCPLFGGFIIVSKPWYAGFDLEAPERVAKKHVEKLSVQSELALLEDPADLWTAKEAAFKAFSKSHGLLLTADAVISRSRAWHGGGFEYEAFSRINPSQTGRGWVFSHEGVRAAVFFSSGKALPLPK